MQCVFAFVQGVFQINYYTYCKCYTRFTVPCTGKSPNDHLNLTYKTADLTCTNDPHFQGQRRGNAKAAGSAPLIEHSGRYHGVYRPALSEPIRRMNDLG